VPAVGAPGSGQGGHFEEVTGQLGATGYTGSVCSGNFSRGEAPDLGWRNRTKMLAVADCVEAEFRADWGARQTLAAVTRLASITLGRSPAARGLHRRSDSGGSPSRG